MVHPTVDPAKLADVQGVAAKLSLLPEQLLMYIAGYTEGVLAMAEEQDSIGLHREDRETEKR